MAPSGTGGHGGHGVLGVQGHFVHPVRDIRVVTHVDDFLVAGEREDLLSLRDEMSKK